MSRFPRAVSLPLRAPTPEPPPVIQFRLRSPQPLRFHRSSIQPLRDFETDERVMLRQRLARPRIATFSRAYARSFPVTGTRLRRIPNRQLRVDWSTSDERMSKASTPSHSRRTFPVLCTGRHFAHRTRRYIGGSQHGAASGEDRKAFEKPLLRRKQIVAPINERPHRLVPGKPLCDRRQLGSETAGRAFAKSPIRKRCSHVRRQARSRVECRPAASRCPRPDGALSSLSANPRSLACAAGRTARRRRNLLQERAQPWISCCAGRAARGSRYVCSRRSVTARGLLQESTSADSRKARDGDGCRLRDHNSQLSRMRQHADFFLLLKRVERAVTSSNGPVG